MNKKLPLISLFIMSIVSILYWTLIPKEKLYEAKWNAPDTTLAITINGEISTTFPTTSAYTGTVECTNGTGKVEWNGTKWILTTSGITKGSTKCNATFITRMPTLSEAILANNEVKTALTTPGKEISAYKLSDISGTTYTIYANTQGYYFTYGTGWTANGDKFNLTGAAVTNDTYANSYSSLVGKYLPDTSCYFNYADFASDTAGTMETTTKLNGVWYVVSATSNSITCKLLTSNKNVTEAVLASSEDDYGTSYYFRGIVRNNYVQFANKCWRIVRITGNNSVKLVLYNKNSLGVADPCSSVNKQSNAAYDGYRAYNENYNDNTYTGIMYGSAGASNYANAQANTNKSTILTVLETWYENNLSSYESKLADTIWCSDKSVVNDRRYDPIEWSPRSGFGYSTNISYYNSYKRLVSSNDKPGGTGVSFICPNDNNGGKLSKFTVSDTTNGNGKLTYKIGLLTVDEVAFAGYSYDTDYVSPANYLRENADYFGWWTMSPAVFITSGARVWEADYSGYLNNKLVSEDDGIRPAISLASSVTISGGSGTSKDPYVVN